MAPTAFSDQHLDLLKLILNLLDSSKNEPDAPRRDIPHRIRTDLEQCLLADSQASVLTFWLKQGWIELLVDKVYRKWQSLVLFSPTESIELEEHWPTMSCLELLLMLLDTVPAEKSQNWIEKLWVTLISLEYLNGRFLKEWQALFGVSADEHYRTAHLLTDHLVQRHPEIFIVHCKEWLRLLWRCVKSNHSVLANLTANQYSALISNLELIKSKFWFLFENSREDAACLLTLVAHQLSQSALEDNADKCQVPEHLFVSLAYLNLLNENPVK